MSCEIYSMEHSGKRLYLEKYKGDPVVALPQRGAAYTPGPRWRRHAALGDSEALWCEAWRAPDSGGLFVLWDADEPLLLVLAENNLAFVEGVGRYSRLTTYARYGADVFEHVDADDDE